MTPQLLIYKPLRAVLSSMPFGVIMFYTRVMGVLQLVFGLGWLLDRLGLCVQSNLPKIAGESLWARTKWQFAGATLNTFDKYGAHHYQHLKSDEEIRALTHSLQPDASKILNMDKYFLRPAPIGCALRIFR